jgi:hypothetical protein
MKKDFVDLLNSESSCRSQPALRLERMLVTFVLNKSAMFNVEIHVMLTILAESMSIFCMSFDAAFLNLFVTACRGCSKFQGFFAWTQPRNLAPFPT